MISLADSSAAQSHTRSGALSRRLWRAMRERVYPHLDGTAALDGHAFDPRYAMRPHARSHRIGWTHYGVMIPDLPAPHRFFSIMSIIGTPGALAFDTDHARPSTPRRSATVVSGTAATHPAHFGGYTIGQDGEFADDGSHIRFGNAISLSGRYPEFSVQARYAGLDLCLKLHATDKVTWFIKTPVYDHLSLLCRVEGHADWQGSRTCIRSLGTYEYAACPSPYLLRDRPLPDSRKLPMDFFTYQIINLAEQGVQVLLTQIRMAGVLAVNKVYVRGLDRCTRTYEGAAVRFEIQHLHEPPERTPDGRRMALPAQFAWTVHDDGRECLHLQAVTDTPFTYGLGSGFVGGYRYEGRFEQADIAGRGYIEYIDRREE